MALSGSGRVNMLICVFICKMKKGASIGMEHGLSRCYHVTQVVAKKEVSKFLFQLHQTLIIIIIKKKCIKRSGFLNLDLRPSLCRSQKVLIVLVCIKMLVLCNLLTISTRYVSKNQIKICQLDIHF